MIDTTALLQNINMHDLINPIAETIKISNRAWCPFCQGGHKTSTGSPAMAVSRDSFKCFGCGEGGDAIDFIMLRDKVDFVTACKILGWDGGQNINHAEQARRMEESAIQRKADQERRAAELDAILAEYSAEEIWLAYSRRMTTDNVAWWERRGIPKEWQKYLDLGFVKSKTYRGRDGLLTSSAYTIPYFHFNGVGKQFQTLQYRLDNPERPQDRYRFERGLKATWYQVVNTEPVKEWAVICEGAIKAIVTKLYGDLGDQVSILAVPAKGSEAGIVEAVKHCRRVWIVLDPDCYKKPANAADTWMPAPERLAAEIGKASRVVRLPEKIDDMFLQGFEASAWKRALKDARQ